VLTESRAIRIVIADDHPLVLDGLVYRLELSQQFSLVGCVNNIKEAKNVIGELIPDVVLMDFNMLTMGGAEIIRVFKKNFPTVKLLVLSACDDMRYVMRMIEIGARGYILKSASADEMLMAIKLIHQVGVYYNSASIVELLMSRKQKFIENSSLSSREHVILKLLSNGMSNKDMARELDISTRTVETHRRNIKLKLEVSTTPGLVRYAIDHGIAE